VEGVSNGRISTESIAAFEPERISVLYLERITGAGNGGIGWGGAVVCISTLPREGVRGKFPLSPAALPEVGDDPKGYSGGRFWLVNTERGLLALYMVCTHLGCLYKWVPNNDRFECPCHASQYTREGTKISGPTPRNLDRFVIQALDGEGNVLAETKQGNAGDDPAAGAPLSLPDETVAISILTGERVKGAPASYVSLDNV
jgi:cytochrome b6-f complex iron-sulfur subunit